MKSFSINAWSEIGVEVLKYNEKIWINEKHLKTAHGYKKLASNKIIVTNLKKEDMN